MSQAGSSGVSLGSPATAGVTTGGPVGSRVLGLDASRGLALLGILVVNSLSFSMPSGQVYQGPMPTNAGWAEWFAAGLVRTVFEAKFYPLFAMLFGMGAWVLIDRARQRQADGHGPWVAMFLRRMVFLTVVGVMHGVLLWYGDILLLYSLAGMLLAVVMLLRLSPRVELALGAGLVVFAALVMLGFAALQTVAANSAGGAATAASTARGGAAIDPEAERYAADRSVPVVSRLFGTSEEHHFDAAHPIYQRLETEAYKEGPYASAAQLRAVSVVINLLFMVITGTMLSVVGLFMVGSALFRLGLLSSGGGRLRAWCMVLGWGVALPLSTALTLALKGSSAEAFFIWYSATIVLGPLMALALISAIGWAAHAGVAGGVLGALAKTGQMSLTNYLTQTVVGTFVMYHWGLAQFGEWSRAGLLAGCAALFAAQVAFSVVWLRTLQYGPMEWVWRAWTRLERPRMLRGPAEPASPGA